MSRLPSGNPVSSVNGWRDHFAFACFQSVVIVDSANDIGGDSVVPHSVAIGESRRIMLDQEQDKDQQHR